MSNFDPGVVDPGTPSVPPGGPPPAIDPEDIIVDEDDIREPDGDDAPPIEPDPEETNGSVPVIRT